MKIPTKLLLVLLVLVSVLLTSSQASWFKSRCKMKVFTVKNRKICLQIGYCRKKNCPKSLKCDKCVRPSVPTAPTTQATTNEASTTEATTTIATTAPVIPDECDRVEDGVCFQSCTAGGCNMECYNSQYYHSCEQSCTGEYRSQFTLFAANTTEANNRLIESELEANTVKSRL